MTLEEAIRLISDTIGVSLSLDAPQTTEQICLGNIQDRPIFGPMDKPSIMALLRALSIDSPKDPISERSQLWLSALFSDADKPPLSPILPIQGRLLALRPIRAENLNLLLDILAMQLAAQPLYYDAELLLTVVPEEEQLKEGVLALSETLSFELDSAAHIFLSQRYVDFEQLKIAHQSILTMCSAHETGLIKAPALFEEVTTSLLLHEWLSAKPGPVTTALLNKSLFADFDEELEKTAEMLFKMNLNLTDAAKALFIHRNTLIYRLDKINKQFGLDLRSFEDAFELKLILTLIKHHRQ